FLRAAEFFENLGNRYSRIGAGVILVEASKQIYALNAPPLGNLVPSSIKVLKELRDPKPVVRDYSVSVQKVSKKCK
mgnify:CR=1